jgi:RNA ligase
MVQDIRSYLSDHDLWNIDNLKDYAEHNNVRVIESKNYPFLVMLHYKESAVYDNEWPTFAKMCRGIILDMNDRKVLAYPFDKFFNLGQMPETNYEILKDKKEFEVSEKLDGSMIILFQDPSTGEYVATTTGSFESEHGKFATSIIPESVKQLKWVEEYTLMFELISSQFRIVIDYRKKNYPEGLYLIGARSKLSNRLLTYSEVAEIATLLGVGCARTYTFDSLDTLIAQTESMGVLDEGFVIRYPDDLMVKVKGPAYLKAHRFISQLSDKHILEVVAEGVEDPLIEVCPDEFRSEVIEKVAYFKRRKLDLLNDCYKYFSEAPKDTRKDFALWVQANVKPSLKGCLFQLMDCRPLKDKDLYDIISKMEKPSVETRI